MAKTKSAPERPLSAAHKEAQAAEKLYMENTLLRIAGALFCHDAKRAPTRTDEIELNEGASDKHIVITPDARLGQPGPLAHKIFVALIKKHSDYGRPIQKEVSFTRREIGRLIGRKDWGGRDSEQLARALHEIHRTFIRTQFKGAAGRFIEHSFVVFPEILLERREFASDPIESCTVTLAEPILASLRDEHFTCLNHALMTRLGTIAQALYMRLFFHFANLYEGRAGKRFSFAKRYDAICAEWLGGLTVHEHKSRIVDDQLGPHLRQLVEVGVLSSYAVEKAKGRGGFVIRFRPGAAFFEDYERFYRRRKQGELQWNFHGDRRAIGDPLKVAYLFTTKRTGQPPASIDFVPSKDVETAKQLLAAIPLEDMSTFLDYALAEANRTNFAIQTLGGVKAYVDPYLAVKKRWASDAARVAAAKAKEEEAETRRIAFDRYRRAQATEILASLTPQERALIDKQAETYAARFPKTLQESMLAFGRVRFTIERHGDRFTSFEDWLAQAA